MTTSIKPPKVYLVGGAVRDKLLHLTVKDQDWLVVGATADDLLALGYKPIGQDFPVFLHPKTQEEYALARTERKTGKGYAGFQFHAAPDVSLEQDLQRRDLTINAMAEDENGQIIDPFHGQDDLAEGVLRHVSPAFSEDPVRILRVARFAARFGFRVADETLRLMCTMVNNGEVDALVGERVWQELSRALGEPQPEKFFSVLFDCGALARLFPAWQPLFVCDKQQTSRAVVYLQQAAAQGLDGAQRFAGFNAALLDYYAPDDALRQLQPLCQRYKVPKSYQILAQTVLRWHKALPEKKQADKILTLLENLDAYRRPPLLADFIQVCYCITRNPSWVWLSQAFELTQKLNARAWVAQGLSGVAVGQAIHQQRQAQLQQHGFA